MLTLNLYCNKYYRNVCCFIIIILTCIVFTTTFEQPLFRVICPDILIKRQVERHRYPSNKYGMSSCEEHISTKYTYGQYTSSRANNNIVNVTANASRWPKFGLAGERSDATLVAQYGERISNAVLGEHGRTRTCGERSCRAYTDDAKFIPSIILSPSNTGLGCKKQKKK